MSFCRGQPARPGDHADDDEVRRADGGDRLGKPIVVTTGTNHSKFTVDGNISDHFSGHACDIGMIANGGSDDSPVGDRIMEAAALGAVACRATRRGERTEAGGLFNLVHDGICGSSASGRR